MNRKRYILSQYNKLREVYYSEPKKLAKATAVKNKDIPKEIEDYILLALNFFPELKDTPIRFKIKKSLFYMESKPIVPFIFSKQRKYQINMNYRFKNLTSTLSPESVAALISHELAHVVDYEEMSVLDLIEFAIKYPFPRFRKQIELSNDIRCFCHGIGEYMLKYLKETRGSKRVSKAVKKYRYKYYLREEEVKGLLSNEIC